MCDMLRVQSLKHWKIIYEIETFILYTGCLNAIEKKDPNLWIRKSSMSLSLFGSIDHRKQTRSLQVGCVTGQLPFLLSFENDVFSLFESVVLDHCHSRVLGRNKKRICWKWAWCPVVYSPIQAMIKWIICAVVWTESFTVQQEIRQRGHLWHIRE